MENPVKPADLILTSRAVFTGAQDAPRPSAVALHGDRIVWVGPAETLPDGLRGPDTTVEDLGLSLIDI